MRKNKHFGSQDGREDATYKSRLRYDIKMEHGRVLCERVCWTEVAQDKV
jgi:hypothetical protein